MYLVEPFSVVERGQLNAQGEKELVWASVCVVCVVWWDGYGVG